MRLFTRPNLIIAVLGLAGVASLLLVPFEALVPAALRDEVAGLNPLLFLVQPVLLVLAACLAGGMLAQRVGLGAPLIEAMSGGQAQGQGQGRDQTLRRALVAGLLGGVIAGLVLWAYAVMSPLQGIEIPLATRILYGGITEEVIARFGIMTVAVWLISRFAGLSSTVYVAGAAIAAIIFAAGHLPLLFTLAPTASSGLIAFVLAANFAAGLIFGVLYWRRGLESAMIAHACAHVFAVLLQAVV